MRWTLHPGTLVRAAGGCRDVVSDGLLAHNLFVNGYAKLGGLVVLFMLLHYIPTYLMLLRAANQMFYPQVKLEC